MNGTTHFLPCEPERLKLSAVNPPSSDTTNFWTLIGASFGYKILLSLVGALKGVLLARLLVPEARGTYGIAHSVLQIATHLTVLGQDRAASHFASCRPDAIPSMLSNQWRQISIVGTAGALIVAGYLSSFEPRLVFLVTLALPLSLGYQLIRSLVLGRQDIRSFNLGELLAQSLSVAVLIAFAFGGSLDARTAFLFAAILPLLAAGAYLLRNLRQGKMLDGKANRALAQEMLSYGAKAYVLATALALTSGINIFVVDFFLGREQSGYFAVAQRAAATLNILALPFSQLLLPYVSAAAASSKESWRTVVQSTGLVLVTGLVVGVGASLLITPLIEILYGSAYLPASRPCVLLIFGEACAGASTVLVSFLAAKRYPRSVLWTALAIALGGCVLSPALTAKLGLEGTALAFLITQGILLAALVIISNRHRSLDAWNR